MQIVRWKLQIVTKMGSDARRRRKRTEAKNNDHKFTGTKKAHEGSRGRANYYFLIIGVFACFTTFIIYKFRNSPISPKVIDDLEFQDLVPPFSPNDYLKRGQKLHKNLIGAESIATDGKNNLYTGLGNGTLIKIRCKANGDIAEESDAVSVVNHSPMGQRSRILGIRHNDNKLYYADPFHGIFTLDLSNNKVEKLVANDDVDPPMKFADDLVLTSDSKTIYFTDASSRWGYEDVAYSTLEDECTGRVLKLNVVTKQIDVLVNDLCFANGIELNSDETRIILSETTRYRVKIIDLKTKVVVKSIVLPGKPDNIRRSANNGYWVAMPQLHEAWLDWVMKFPFIRATMASLFSSELIIRSNTFSTGAVVKLDEEGDVIKVMYDLDGTISSAVTQVTETKNGKLLLGSFIKPGIVQVDS